MHGDDTKQHSPQNIAIARIINVKFVNASMARNCSGAVQRKVQLVSAAQMLPIDKPYTSAPARRLTHSRGVFAVICWPKWG